MTADVVVGAGLAGLAAAVRLHAAGRDVLVLEASDGVGGGDPGLSARLVARVAALYDLSSTDVQEIGRYDIRAALPAMPPPLAPDPQAEGGRS
ncbi:MAG: FAD-dependent oxidoreductase [Sporichthyaceae bacterium]